MNTPLVKTNSIKLLVQSSEFQSALRNQKDSQAFFHLVKTQVKQSI